MQWVIINECDFFMYTNVSTFGTPALLSELMLSKQLIMFQTISGSK
jgi:hypothetical protein